MGFRLLWDTSLSINEESRWTPEQWTVEDVDGVCECARLCATSERRCDWFQYDQEGDCVLFRLNMNMVSDTTLMEDIGGRGGTVPY